MVENMRQFVGKPKFSRSQSNLVEDEKTHSADIKGGWEGRIIFRWRKSLWKNIWKELLAYTCVYLLISIIYRFTLTQSQQDKFKDIIKHFNDYHDGVPLTFILGLYIGLVVKRWWDQYISLPWPDDLALHLRACIIGRDDKMAGLKERGRLVRRTIVRYCLVSYILAIRRQSSRLRKRFPTVGHIKETGLLTEEENERLQDKDTCEMYTSRWWIPIQWCMDILANAEHEGLVVNAPSYSSLVSQVKIFKQGLQKVKAYGNLPVPLVYSQVVTLAVYVYFGGALIGDQHIIGQPVDMVYPFFLTFKFMFYYGLLTVATSLYNPWGVDEEDFQLNKLISRHLKVAMAIVDDTEEPPKMVKDVFWDNSNPKMLDQLDEDHEVNGLIDIEPRAENQSIKEVVCNSERTDPGKNAKSV